MHLFYTSLALSCRGGRKVPSGDSDDSTASVSGRPLTPQTVAQQSLCAPRLTLDLPSAGGLVAALPQERRPGPREDESGVLGHVLLRPLPPRPLCPEAMILAATLHGGMCPAGACAGLGDNQAGSLLCPDCAGQWGGQTRECTVSTQEVTL